MKSVCSYRRPPYNGFPTLTVTRIEGGTGSNVVPDKTVVTVGRRLVPGEDPDRISQELVELARRSCPLPFTVGEVWGFGAFYQSPDSPWIKDLAGWSG
ncbi:MAG: M20 family metallopeptidase, partial [Fuerstiella sp.]|nr:M20 family metallopeptidase [Fuerstiella sp.]